MRQKPTGRPSSSEQIIRDIKPKINLNSVFAGQTVGIREVADQIWLVSFMHYDFGFFDKEEGRVEPGPNPFAPEKVLPMSPVWTARHWRPQGGSNPRCRRERAES